MKYIKSCGFIVFKRIDHKNCYLIMQSTNGDFGFPKGHMEQGETEIETAIRELKEETNVEVEVINGFRRLIQYSLPNRPDAIKQSVYFLGKCIDDSVICQEGEVVKAEFLPYEKALDLLSFEDTKKILSEAETFISLR